MPQKKKIQAYQPTGTITRVISLNEGKHAYLIDEKGKLNHFSTNSTEFVQACKDIDEALEGIITRDLTLLGWDKTLSRMLEL